MLWLDFCQVKADDVNVDFWWIYDFQVDFKWILSGFEYIISWNTWMI
jgi:hypothetical protein